MKRINYGLLSPSEWSQFIAEYKAIFAKDLSDSIDNSGKTIKGLESRWSDWKAKHDRKGKIPERVSDLLTADFHQLVDVYKRFRSIGIPLKKRYGKKRASRNKVLKDLDDIFDYTNKYAEKIADFFIKWSNKLQIYSCYYCEMAYVNTYTQKGRKGVVKRQFDLDHFLPKAKCPCVGLSLFNFVPSCQVCNSRIKLDNLPRMKKAEYEMVSPSSLVADFDKHITFKLRMSAKGAGLMGKRYVYVKSDPPYHKYVRFFHLQERYGFHLKEAIRLKELKQRYPDSAIRKIASMLGYGEYRVKEDIFQEQYLKQEGRCFAKFSIDMLTK